MSKSKASAATLGLKSTDCLKILTFQRYRLSHQVIKLLAKGGGLKTVPLCGNWKVTNATSLTSFSKIMRGSFRS